MRLSSIFNTCALAFVTALSLSLYSCDKEPGTNDNPIPELIERKDITLTRAQMDFVKSNNRFSLDLFRKVADEENEKGMLISPISVTYALGMVDNGAVGNTRKEICEVLGYDGESVKGLNDFCKTMLEQGAAVDPSTTIDIANMAVVNKASVPLKEGFTKDIESNYQAKVCHKDFAKEDVKTFINKWCEEKTRGMIKNFLSEQPAPGEFAHFLNAVYFKGIWSSQFKKDQSKEERFTDSDGNKISVKMMHQEARFNYGGLQGLCRAVCLPYGNQAYRMTVILPEDGRKLSDVREALTPEKWEDLNKMVGEMVDVKLPSFETEFGTKDIHKALLEMGIKDAFNPTKADFSGMTSASVYISDVLHKAKIKVDEQGSEAAAVTDVVMRDTSVGPAGESKPIVFHADHPFIYAITEVSTGAIFFIGQYTGK